MREFSPDEFIKTLKYIYILSVRYNVICRFSANEQENRYNSIAIKIANGEFQRASHIKNSPDYKALYPADDEFKNTFEYFKMPSRRSFKKIRFLLAEIEKYAGRKVGYLDTTLEHVCPYNPAQEWYQQFGEGVNDITDWLGNMVLLEQNNLQQADFASKKAHYLNTHFRLAKKVAEYDHWDLTNLNRYQSWLADQAVRTWRVD